MAQRPRSSRSGGSAGRGRNSASRGGYAAPARKGSNPGPLILAVVLVLGAVALIVALQSGKKKEDPPRHPTASSGSDLPTGKPRETAPKPPPYPEISEALRQQAKDVATKARDLQKDGEAVYQEAAAAHRAGRDDEWQEKLEEASAFFYEIQDLYNDFLGEVPTNDHYNEDEVANYYLGAEADIVTRAMSRLMDIKKQRRK